MRRLIFLILIAATAAIFAGCETTAPNTNNARANANNNSNANNIVVVNNNANANTMTNRWSNTNVSRDEYDKNRADYEKDKGDSTIGTGANDSWIWFKTRTALATTADLRDSTINVDVSNAKTTLRGTVATAAQKKKAEEVAKGIDGQQGVTNQLKVSATDSVTNMSSTDSDKKANSNMNKK